jgi:hypothetical protein
MLTWFHLVFIALSLVMSGAFGVWGFVHHETALGIAGLAASAALGAYGWYFVGKARAFAD